MYANSTEKNITNVTSFTKKSKDKENKGNTKIRISTKDRRGRKRNEFHIKDIDVTIEPGNDHDINQKSVVWLENLWKSMRILTLHLLV
jgi:hypothetical protein